MLHRWLSAFHFTAPLVWALALGAAFVYAHEALARLTIPLGVVAELGSGLPPAVMFAATLALAHGTATILRRPRPSLPNGIRFAAVAILVVVFTVLLDGVLARQNLLGPWPPTRLLPLFLGTRMLLPALLAAAAAVGCSRLLQLPRPQSLLRVLFGAEPP